MKGKNSKGKMAVPQYDYTNDRSANYSKDNITVRIQ